MKKQQGFTLIELMIVVAIIAILAAIAISQYQDYVIRSQVSEGSSLADGTKTAVAEFYNNYGRFAADNASLGLRLRLRSSASTSSRRRRRYRPGPDHRRDLRRDRPHEDPTGDALVFSPITHAGSIEWSCNTAAGTTVESKYRPTPCRD